jgi:hypothetical protein
MNSITLTFDAGTSGLTGIREKDGFGSSTS